MRKVSHRAKLAQLAITAPRQLSQDAPHKMKLLTTTVLVAATNPKELCAQLELTTIKMHLLLVMIVGRAPLASTVF